MEEFRKTLCSLWQGSQTAFSPDSLFYAIWKIMPSFRYVTSSVLNAEQTSFELAKVRHGFISKWTSDADQCTVYDSDQTFGSPEVISSRMPTSSCATCWTTCTGSFSAAAMERLALCLHQGASDCRPRREKAACKQHLSSTFQSCNLS